MTNRNFASRHHRIEVGLLIAAFLLWWSYAPSTINADPFPSRNPDGELADLCSHLNDTAISDLLGVVDIDLLIKHQDRELVNSFYDRVYPAMYNVRCTINTESPCSTMRKQANVSQVVLFLAAMSDGPRAEGRFEMNIAQARRDRPNEIVDFRPAQEIFGVEYSDGSVTYRILLDRFVLVIHGAPCDDEDLHDLAELTKVIDATTPEDLIVSGPPVG